jgi:hypothetical protein
MLHQIFVDSCEDIISIDKVSSSLQKDEVADCIEFSSVCKKYGLVQIINPTGKDSPGFYQLKFDPI